MASAVPPSSWDNLPPDLLKIITDHLDITSFIRLSAVCTAWTSTIRSHLPSLPPFRCDRPIPWLLLSANQNTEITSTHIRIHTDFTFYDLSTATSCSVHADNIPSLRFQQWLGCYKGWLVTADLARALRLIKPLTGACVRLPFFLRKDDFPRKVVLCHTSDKVDELPVAFCLSNHRRLCMAKAGGMRWTPLRNNSCYEDIISYQGKVYAASTHGLCCYDPKTPPFHKWEMNLSYNLLWFYSHNKYLLEWKGELFALIINWEYPMPDEVKLYKVNLLKDATCELIQVASLGSNALFFSPNCSYILPASAFSRDNIRENCIYFTDKVSSCPCHDAQGFHPNHNFQAYNLANQTTKKFCPYSSPIHTTKPIFFWPC